MHGEDNTQSGPVAGTTLRPAAALFEMNAD
jgi:hypothetical protein